MKDSIDPPNRCKVELKNDMKSVQYATNSVGIFLWMINTHEYIYDLFISFCSFLKDPCQTEMEIIS